MSDPWFKVLYKDRKESGEAVCSWTCQSENEDLARDSWAAECPGDEIVDVEQWPFNPEGFWLPVKMNAGVKPEFPRDAVMLVGLEGDEIQFCHAGGGRVMQGKVSKFRKDFRRATADDLISEYRLSIFSFDDGPAVIGFSGGYRWNGWGCPIIPVEALHRWIEEEKRLFGESNFVMRQGKLHYRYDVGGDDPYEYEEVQRTNVAYKGRAFECYDAGMALCWWEEDLRDLPSKSRDFDNETILRAIVPEGIEINLNDYTT